MKIIQGGKGSFYLDDSYPEFRKTALIRAVQMDGTFAVNTMEGVMRGVAGDWLAQGPAGELWVIDKEVFEETYEQA